MTDIIASLVFDSWMETIPELRNGSLEDRHLIYEDGGVVLDLLLKCTEDGVCLHIGGQILPSGESLSDVSDVTVLLEYDGRHLHTQTNALGEFMFHTIPNESFDLAVVLKDRRFMVRGLASNQPRMWRVVPAAAGGAS